ncbi:hypothetical protein LTR56_006842 [Elasticomyces elasticus]|nr:hypothetical protein LTR56_006842 [Elasticomyces elasticus]KAK3659528.1 hypothetical protein LTR22_008445 [Elasticomyces elasticus]KAK4923256.1 hypothetical protein LTR49_009519 [Elasticomyces elasticus]KAK5757641.1 hypothetical protein LTS12_012243 [Elasticomyces elasticus]
MQQHFPFFELPKELRNKIYADCTTCASFRRPERGLWHTSFTIHSIEMSGLLIIDLLTLEKRFGKEYKEESLRYVEAAVRTYYMSSVDVQETMALLPRTYHASLSKLKLRLRLPKNDAFLRDQLSDIAEQGVADLSKLISALPGMPSLELEVELPVVKLSLASQKAAYNGVQQADSHGTHFLRSELVAKKSLEKSDALLLPVAKSLIVYGDLYYVTQEHLWEDWEVRSALLSESSNHVVYEATVSRNAEAWCGLDLTMIEAGCYDYDAAVRKVEEEREKAKLSQKNA